MNSANCRGSYTRTVAIVQSNYIPWRGYFDLLRSADELILLDSVQYTRRDWRNRNLIKTRQGPQWITIPVEVKGKYLQAIDETRIAGADWAERHIRAINASYGRAAGYANVSPWLFEALRSAANDPLLTNVNERLLRAIAGRLGINTPIRRCTELLDRDEMTTMNASARLLALCRAASAERYLSGPSARDYLDESLFARAGIEVAWMDYAGYPEYEQLWGAFEPRVSIIDLLLNMGDHSTTFVGRHVSQTKSAHD